MNGKKYSVLASGYVSMDHILKIKSPAKIGFTSLIDNGTNIKTYYGGRSVNIAFALSRLGMSSMPMIRVGDDYETSGFKAFLQNGNVPTDAITVVEGETTSVCYLVQDNEGQHITLFYPGSMNGRYAKPWPDNFFKNAQMGVITVGARRDNEIFFESCKKHRLPLVFGMKGDMDAFPPDFLKEILFYSRIVFANECERETMERILGISLPELLLRGKAEVVVTTLGKKGSKFYYKDEKSSENFPQKGFVPIFDCTLPVDASGTGDAYISGFLYGYLKNRSVHECAMLGTVMSSFAVEAEGCCTALPDEKGLSERFENFKRELRG